MRRRAAVFTIALALGAIILAPRGRTQAQDAREEGPREIEKCRTIDKPGSYKLVNNLTFSGLVGTCLSITTGFVTIDLAGFTISGPNLGQFSGNIGTATAIGATPPSGKVLEAIAVRNGSISGFLAVVDLSSADGSIVEGLRISGGGNSVAGGGIIASGIVKGNTVSGNDTVGISATGTVTGNYALGNFVGISVGAGSTVIGNTATSSRRLGIVVACPSNVTDNTAVNNRFGNLQLFGDGCNNTNNVAP